MNMSVEGLDCGANRMDLLYQLEHLLESDLLIDEVGFLHPSQFDTLSEEASSVFLSTGCMLQADKSDDAIFWSRDHKLGISVNVLLPLYSAAKHAFMASLGRYRTNITCSNFSSSSFSVLENELMKHSKALLLLSCDFGTAWNARKLVILMKQHLPIFMDELFFSALVLSYSPKSERAWNHRQWVIKMIAGKSSNLQEILEKESDFVKKLAEKSKMNYRAWNYRCWFVSYMSSGQLLQELNDSREWARLHVTDNSCFHFRTCLILRMLKNSWSKEELHKLWKDELDWDEMLIKQYIGREGLWLHRRFLSLFWMKYLVSGNSSCQSSLNNDVDMYLGNELRLCQSCRNIPDNEFEDYQAQAIHSATYIMWLAKHVSEYLGIGLSEKMQEEELQMLIENLCPRKSFIFDSMKVPSACGNI